jgi:hypothetical protein
MLKVIDLKKIKKTAEQVYKVNLQYWSKKQIVTVLQDGKFISNGGPNKVGFIKDFF